MKDEDYFDGTEVYVIENALIMKEGVNANGVMWPAEVLEEAAKHANKNKIFGKFNCPVVDSIPESAADFKADNFRVKPSGLVCDIHLKKPLSIHDKSSYSARGIIAIKPDNVIDGFGILCVAGIIHKEEENGNAKPDGT